MSPPGGTTGLAPWTAGAAAAMVLLIGLLPAAALAAPAPPEVEARLALRTPLVEATLGEAHGTFVLRQLREAPPQLETLLSFSQPAVRGEDHYLAVLWVRPLANASWSGAWWADSSAGASLPRKVTIGADGAFLVVEGGARATGDRVTVTFTFVGQDARAWTHAMPAVPVFDAPPQGAGVVLAGAAVTRHAHADLPQGVLLTPWNLLGHDAEMGFSVLDAAGNVLQDHRVGACLDGAGNVTEAGCRATYLVEMEGARIVTWHVGADGARVHHESHAVDALRERAHVHGADGLAASRWDAPLVEAEAEAHVSA